MKLVESFLIIQFNENQEEPDKRREVIYTFPEDFGDAGVKRSVALFAFPEDSIQNYLDADCSRAEEFTLMLTTRDGSKLHGFCRRFVAQIKPAGILCCYCLIGKTSSFALSSQIVDIVELLNDREELTSYLQLLTQKQFPRQGETVQIQLDESDKKKMFRLTRPLIGDYEYLDHVSFEPIFSFLPVPIIIEVFEALIVERRVILIASTLSQLTSCINAISAMLYPFAWQHVFIPILPRTLIEFVQAPMPFLIGMLSSTEPHLASQSIESDAVILHINKGVFLQHEKEKSVITSQTTQLSRILSTVVATERRLNLSLTATHSTDGAEFNDLIAPCFFNFWAEYFGGYAKFFRENKTFATDRFIRSQPFSQQQFVGHLMQTQMASVFVQQREAMLRSNNLQDCEFLKITKPILKRKMDYILSLRRNPAERMFGRENTESNASMLRSTIKGLAEALEFNSKPDPTPEPNKITLKPQVVPTNPAKKYRQPQRPRFSSPKQHLAAKACVEAAKTLAEAKDTSKNHEDFEEIAIVSPRKDSARKETIYMDSSCSSLSESCECSAAEEDSRSEEEVTQQPPSPSTELFLGLGSDKDGSLLRHDLQQQFCIESSEGTKCIVYRLLFQKRHPRIYQDTVAHQKPLEGPFQLPLSHQELVCFLDHLLNENFQFESLNFHQQLNLLAFYRVDFPELRWALTKYMGANIRSDNCIELIHQLYLFKQLNPHYPEIDFLLNRARYHFSMHWNDLVSSDELLALPSSLLVELMRYKTSKVRVFSPQLSAHARMSSLKSVYQSLYFQTDSFDFHLRTDFHSVPLHKYILFSYYNTKLDPTLISRNEAFVSSTVLNIEPVRFVLKFIYFQEEAAVDNLTIPFAKQVLEFAELIFHDTSALAQTLASSLFVTLSVKNVLSVLAEVCRAQLPPLFKRQIFSFLALNFNAMSPSWQSKLQPNCKDEFVEYLLTERKN